MPHQCTKCGKVFPDAAEELLKGCSCGSRFFYYIRQEKFDEMQSEVKKVMDELEKADKEQIEKDIRELTGLAEKPDEPVILDLESVRVIKPGKFEIDIVNLFSKNRPLIYKLEEGKYIIDLASSLSADSKEVNKKIRDPFEGVCMGTKVPLTSHPSLDSEENGEEDSDEDVGEENELKNEESEDENKEDKNGESVEENEVENIESSTQEEAPDVSDNVEENERDKVEDDRMGTKVPLTSHPSLDSDEGEEKEEEKELE